MTTEPPHSYKEQRLLEKRAKQTREQISKQARSTMPPVCGYTYTPRRPKLPPDTPWDATPVVCMRTAGAGTTHQSKGWCDYHEWMDNQAAERKLAKDNQFSKAVKTAEENKRFFGQMKYVDPHSALMEEIQRSASIVAYYEEKLQEFRTVHGMSDEDIMTQATFKDGIKPSVWMELFNTEREHLVRTCIAAIKAGVAERKVQIAEQQGRLIAAMMFAFMHDPELGLSPDQIMRAPGLIRKHLTSIPHANTDAVDPAKVLAAAPQRVAAIETTGDPL
jgi:hypothetical protein